MVWLGVLCVLLAAALVVYVTATERQMRGLSASLAQRSREGRRVRLAFPTAGARALAREANGLIDEADDVRRQAAEERRVLQENLASFSHDVRTPLAGAQGFLQLYAVADSDAERDECVAAAAERLGAMRGLVDALFEYAKADDGSRALAQEPVGMTDVVSDVLAALYPAFAERGWQPTVLLAEGVVVEPEAAESGASGFSLTVSNAAEDLDVLDANRLGERFYRGDPSRRAGDSGLGLATARSLADAMGLHLRPSIEGDHFIVTFSS